MTQLRTAQGDGMGMPTGAFQLERDLGSNDSLVREGSDMC